MIVPGKLSFISEHLAKSFLNNTFSFNPLSANFTKSPNTLKQFVGKLLKNCLSA